MITFVLAVIVLVATPGPALLSILGVGTSFGFRVGLAYTAGVLIGANVVSLMAVIGLLSFVTAFPKFKLLFTLLSICYLLYIAFKIAISKGHPTPINRPADIGIFDGILIQLINPKAYAVALALFSGFPFFEQSLMVETILKFLIANAIWIPAHFFWLYFGESLRKLDLSREKIVILNYSLAFLMVLAVALSII